MRKTMFLVLCSLSVVGCSLEGDPEPNEMEQQPLPEGPCGDVSDFDLGVFEDEIMPILTGEVDHNPEADMNVGCARSACHGRDRGTDTLFLDVNDTPANNLSRFACFVDLADPPASQMLVCGLGDSTCIANPHPGGPVYSGVTDLNYVQVLSYLYDAANLAALTDSL